MIEAQPVVFFLGAEMEAAAYLQQEVVGDAEIDRKSTRLNSSH